MNALSRAGLFERIARKFRAVPPQPPPDPVVALLGKPRQVACVVRSRPDADDVKWIDRAKAGGADVDILPLTQSYRREDGRVMSLMSPSPGGPYDRIVVCHRVNLYEHSWSYAFLDRLNAMLTEDGAMLVTAGPGQIAAETLTRLFGANPLARSGHMLSFAKAPKGLRRPVEAVASTLDAYWALSEVFLNETFDPELGEVIEELGETPIALRRHPHETDLCGSLYRQSYRAASARTKAPMVQHILSLNFPSRRDLHLIDFGAGPGFNSMELLLNPSVVAKLTLVEPNNAHRWGIATLYNWLGERVRGKVRLCAALAQDYDGEPGDAVVISSVLSVAEPEWREPILRNAWKSISPGGVMIVYENMRRENPDSTDRLNEARCTPETLDALLGGFGPIRYFHAQRMKELAFKDVGNATVFRVVRKPPS